jgi:hypothetical protein
MRPTATYARSESEGEGEGEDGGGDGARKALAMLFLIRPYGRSEFSGEYA